MQNYLYSHAICSCARMEEQSIIEWINYHSNIGFQHFFIYGNDDDYRVLIETLYPILLGSRSVLTFIHCPDKGAQTEMYMHFLKYFAYKAKWICFLDQDEYIRLGEFDNIDQLTHEYERDFDSIQLNWLNFGTSGFIHRPNGSVLRNYTKRTSSVDIHTKHITKSDVFYKVNIYGPFWHSLPNNEVRTCNSIGDEQSFWSYLTNDSKVEYEEYLKENSSRLIDSACIAHYFFKSEDDFMRRLERSLSGDFSGQIIYFEIKNDEKRRLDFLQKINEVEDRFLADYWINRIDLLFKETIRWG